MRQVFLPSFRSSTEHGGDKMRGRRKTARPVVTRRPMHVTLRAEVARGRLSFLTPENARLVRRVLAEQSKRWGVRVMESANVGNHLHLLLRARDRMGFRNFLRCVCGIIALKIAGAGKGRSFGKFWDGLAFSRVVQWGRDLVRVIKYIELNQMEAAGISRVEARRIQAAAEGWPATSFPSPGATKVREFLP